MAEPQVFAIGTHGRVEGYLGRDGRLVAHGELSLDHPNGQVALKGTFVHGKLEGRWYRWYDNGIKMSRHDYVGGKAHGEFVQWYRSGTVAREGRFAQDRATARHRTFHDGPRRTLALEATYRQGRQIDRIRELTQDGAERWVAVEDGRVGRIGGIAIESHAERVCILVPPDHVLSASVAEIIALLSQTLTPGQIELLLQGMNRLYDRHGLDPSNKVLLKCPGGFTSLPASPASSGSLSAAPGGGPDAAAMVDACRNKSIGDLSAAGVGDPETLSAGAWQSWVNAQVDHLDEAFGDCRDRVNPVVADVGAGTDPAGETGFWDAVGQWVNETFKSGVTKVNETGNEVAQLVSTAVNDPEKAVAAVAIVIGYYVISNAMDEPEDPQGKAEHAYAMDALGTAMKGMALGILAESLDEEATRPAPGPPPAGPGGYLPEGGGTISCAQLQEGWSNVKAMCEAADWKTLDCLAFLGVSTRCMQLVMPTPDGGYGCMGAAEGALDVEDHVRDLRRRICEMTAGLFVDNHCIPSESLVPAPSYNPCQDPRALWGPDQCVGTILSSLRQAAPALSAPSRRTAAVHAIASLDDDGFDAIVAQGDKPTLVVFAAAHCGPCLRVLNALGDAADEYEARVRFRMVDITRNPVLAERFAVRYTPTMLMFRAGAVIGVRRVGAAPAHRILRFIDTSLGTATTDIQPAA